MIELRTLGPLDLRAADGTEYGAVLAQPKRLVLLTYLAITPGAFRPRDTLVGLFWPTLDQQRARAALRQAVYHLRRELGSDVVIGRGNELGVDPARLWCDVAAFREAIAEQRYGEALALYRGDLLSGVYLGGTLELERWIDVERGRLRAEAAAAAWTVAEHAAAHDPAEAAAWVRRAVEFAQDDEASVRRAITILARIGDRAGALRIYQELARRLEREYDAEPSAATQALIAEVRAGEIARERSTIGAQPDDLGADPGSELGARTDPDSAAAEAARPVEPATSAARDTAAASASAPGALRPPAVLAVLPFTYHGQAKDREIIAGFDRLLEAGLAGTSVLRCVDGHAVATWLAGPGARLPDDQRIRGVAERFDADYCATGAIVRAGDRLRADAALYSAATPDVPIARVSAEAGVDELFALADRIAAELMGHAVEPMLGPLARAAARTTDSLAALRWFLAGEHAFVSGHYTPAVEAVQRALAEDPHFGLAHYRLATLAEWAGFPERAKAAAASALAGADRLSVNDRRLLRALHAYLDGDVTRAEFLYRKILAVYPDSVEAWFQMAKLGCFLYSLLGRRMVESREAFARVVELDPGHIIAWVHLAIMALKEGRLDEYEALSRRALDLVGPGDYTDYPLIVRIPRAFALGIPEDRDRIWEELESANAFTLFWSFQLLTFLVEDFDAAARVAALMTVSPHPVPVRLFGLLMRAELELARGRWTRARAHLDAATHLDPAVATVHRALLALVDFRDPTPDELHALRDDLLAITPIGTGADRSPDPWFDAHHAVLDTELTYALGRIQVHLGELADAAAHIAALDALAAAAKDFARAAHARDAARGLRARIAWRKGDTAQALACLESLELGAPMHAYIASALYGRLHERHLRGALLAHCGRDDESMIWLAALGDDSPHGFIYRVPSLRLRAEILERRGEHDSARALRDRAEELWRDADPEIRSRISQSSVSAAPSS